MLRSYRVYLTVCGVLTPDNISQQSTAVYSSLQQSTVQLPHSNSSFHMTALLSSHREHFSNIDIILVTQKL